MRVPFRPLQSRRGAAGCRIDPMLDREHVARAAEGRVPAGAAAVPRRIRRAAIRRATAKTGSLSSNAPMPTLLALNPRPDARR